MRANRIRSIGGVLVAVGIVAVVSWIGLARVTSSSDQKRDSSTGPLPERIQLEYHVDDNGAVEGYTLSKDGRVLLILWDDDHDGVLNMWDYYHDGESQVRVMDRNGDRKLDWWQVRTGPEKGTLAEDNDYDGVVDEESEIRFVTKY